MKTNTTKDVKKMGIKTCPYCGSKVKKIKERLFYCDFCEMRLAEDLVKENHERLQVRVREFAADHYVSRSTPDLMGLSSFELLQLLKFIRKERSDMYHHLSVFKRAEKQVQTGEFKDMEQESGKEYEYLTRKMFVLENIIRERLGYVPRKITEAYLLSYLENIKKDKTAPMLIKQERQIEI
ncbi:hypothetical protein MHB63_11755 [Bacillus sp. FSL H8-0547]